MGRITLWGMYNSFPDILDGVELPEPLDRETWIDLLMEECGELYPFRQVPPMFAKSIATWFKSRQTDLKRLTDALKAEYSPIENYDRTEEHKDVLQYSGTDTLTDSLGKSTTITRRGTEKTEGGGTQTTVTTGTEKMENSGSETTQNEVSAYDAVSYTPHDQTTRTPNLTSTRTPDITEVLMPEISSTRTPDLTDVHQDSGSDTHATDYGHTEDHTINIRAHGNIGVTTNQQMIESELALRQKYNIYEIIIKLFADKFLMRVY